MALLRQILSSRTFAKSVRLARFLEFICLRTLEGKAREINEQQIGIHVFSRSPHYIASEDSIVRTQARLLRLRLDEYFESEAPHSPMVISIPKGGYVPVFEPRQSVLVTAPPIPSSSVAVKPEAALPESEIRSEDRPHRRQWLGIAAASVILLILAGWGFHLWMRARIDSPSHLLWSGIFAPGQRAILVPSDDALVLYQELIQAAVPLDEYLSGSYLEQSNPRVGNAELTSNWFAAHQYTSTADLNLAMRLGRLPEAVNADVETRNARVLRLDDLKSSNIVLIGGIGANPWIALFADRLNFDVNYDWKTSEGYVRNKHLQSGEAPIYYEALSNGFRRSYGVLAFLPGLGDDGNVLLFEGTGMAGTESAADFPFNSRSFDDFAHRIGATSTHMPHFEALLETTSVGGNAPESRLIAWRIIQP
ncbi:hypothetical protein [Silvibacterium dinghuense]|uniref:Uncharacterized protein n=1 Tax=Silvibacterium dinghuense TaxID=1560006 RepID=A0A4Q1SBB8_9BACT|nr:hypothetical protein [Silvibacterium dinghuense]RXS94297.1 hypothetical protein ESZ00_14440 [Silvibacterium dinghuense]GGH17112.1 hypothetical protein GCM10011586_39420 [Silvibacterium dinghuense]